MSNDDPDETRLPTPRHCGSYRPGHETHWIPVLKVHVGDERTPVELLGPIKDGWFTVNLGETSERWWHHDAATLEHFLPCNAERVGTTTFLTIPVPGAGKWVYAAKQGSQCPTGPLNT